MIKIAFIDMSRTLVQGSGANSGADFIGQGDTYRELYPKYQAGEINMQELLSKTYFCWRGLKLIDLPKVYERFEFNQNAKETIGRLKEMGLKTMLLTNIPRQLAELFQAELGFDHIGGTLLEVNEGMFTGEILEFGHDKVSEAMKVLKLENIDPVDAFSIGDRKDDAEVFKKVKFGVAYNGDDTARETAKYQISDFKELINIMEKESIS